MKRVEDHSNPIPRHDYEVAIKSAVSWLGDRYLLAAPQPKRHEEPRDYFRQARRWLDLRNVKRHTAIGTTAR